jgi:predicted hydrocarbon binding protein
MIETVYEHEIVTTLRIKFRSLDKYPDKGAMLTNYACLTEWGDLLIYNQPDDYPRIVEVSCADDEVQFFNQEEIDE